MQRTLVLATILANSLTSGMIFSFVPGGDAIKNVVSPFLSSFNTTDDSGNPTYTANLVRVVDPILAMQFAQNDLVSSPEDYSRALHPSIFYPRNSLDSDRAADSRLAYPYYVYPGNPPPESEFVADPKNSGSSNGLPSSLYVSARDPLNMYRASDPGQLETLQGVFSPYYATPDEGFRSKDVNDMGESQKLSNFLQSLRSPLQSNSNSYPNNIVENQRIPYSINAPVHSLAVDRTSDSRSDNQKLPLPLNAPHALPYESAYLNAPGRSEDNNKVPYPDMVKPLSPYDLQSAHDPILAKDSQMLTDYFNRVPMNPFASDRVNDFKNVENSQKSSQPQTLSFQTPLGANRMSVPTHTDNYLASPYPYNLAAANPIESDSLHDSRHENTYQNLPTPLSLASNHHLKSDHDSFPTPDITYGPMIKTDSQKNAYPLNLERGNQIGSNGLRNPQRTPYVNEIPYPMNFLSAAPIIADQADKLRHSEDSPSSPILAPENDYQPKQVTNPTVDRQKLPYPYNLAAWRPVDISSASDPRYRNEYQKPSYSNELSSGRPFESGPVSSRQQSAPKTPLPSQYNSDLRRIDSHPQLRLPLKFVPDSYPLSNQLRDSGISDDHKKSPLPSMPLSINAFETNSMKDPSRSVDKQQLPFPNNLASMSPHIWNRISSPKSVENHQQLPYLRDVASTAPLQSDHMRDVMQGRTPLQNRPTSPSQNTVALTRMNDPMHTENYQDFPSPQNLASNRPVASGPIFNTKPSKYLQASQYPLYLRSRNPNMADQLTRYNSLDNLQRSPHQANLVSKSPYESDQVADPRHLIPMLRRGFDLFNPWTDFPEVYSVAPSRPSHFQHYKRLRPEYYRDDEMYPSDYYLTDYVYPMDDYPIIERYSPENMFQPTADSLVSSQPNLRHPLLTSRAEKNQSPLQVPSEPTSPSQETPKLVLDQIQPPFRSVIESLLRGQNSFDNIPPMYRSLINSLISGNSGLAPKLKADSLIHSVEPLLGESPRMHLKSGNAMPNGPQASEYHSKAANPTGESYRVQLNPNLAEDAGSSPKSNGVQSSGSNPSVNNAESAVYKSVIPAKNTMSDTKPVAGPRGVENQLNTPDVHHANMQPSSSHNTEQGTEAGRTLNTPDTSRDTGAAKSNMDDAYRTRYGPFVEDPYVGCWDWLNPRGKFEEDLFSVPNPFSKNPLVKGKSAHPVATNNINYGIVEPNYGNYPIYSFDNTNPIQNFHHETNPVFNPTEHQKSPTSYPTEHQTHPASNPTEPAFKPPFQVPFFWDPIKKQGNLIVSPFKKPLFTPSDNTGPMRYTDEEAQYLKDLANNFESEPAAPAGSDFNADGVRTNWPKDPKTLAHGDQSGPESPHIPIVPEAQPGKIPALVIVPANDQSQNRQQDPSVDTINSTKNYNLLPIQLPASFLNNLINSGLFSALFNNLPGSDTMRQTKAPGTFSLLSPAKHKIELYNPALRGYHGAINPFAHHHNGVGYKSY